MKISGYNLVCTIKDCKYNSVGKYVCLKTNQVVIIKISKCSKYNKFIINEYICYLLIKKRCGSLLKYVLKPIAFNYFNEFENVYVVYPFVEHCKTKIDKKLIIPTIKKILEFMTILH